MTIEIPPGLPINQVPPGARLAAPVRGADGQVLMTAGSVLTEQALERLGQHGIVAVEIEIRRDEAELDAARAMLRGRLDYLFRRCDPEHDECAQKLFKAVLDHRLETLR